MRIVGKKFISGDEVEEEDVAAVTDGSWLTDEKERSVKEIGNERDGGDGIPA